MSQYPRQEGLAMGSALSPLIVNMYMKYSENLTLGSTTLKRSLELQYIDDTFMLWLQQEDVQVPLDHRNSIKPLGHVI